MSKGQCYAYKDCYEKYNKLYDWMSFFDFDEFLTIKQENTIQKFLSSPRYEQCVTVKINFLFYSDNGLLYYDNRTLQERFTKALYHHPSNRWLKVTVRGGLKTNYWKKNVPRIHPIVIILLVIQKEKNTTSFRSQETKLYLCCFKTLLYKIY